MLKKILSSIAKNPWKSYAISIGADYIDGGFLHSDRIIVHEQSVTIVISIGTNQRGNSGFRYTRFRCSYTSTQSPYFCIKPKKKYSMNGFFSKKNTAFLTLPYELSTPKEELFPILSEDKKIFGLLNTLSDFKYSSEKDDGEYGPVFLATEHQLCLEIAGEIEEPNLLSTGIGIILATLSLLRNNSLLSPEKSSVSY